MEENQNQKNYSNKTIDVIFSEKRAFWKIQMEDTIQKVKDLSTLTLGQVSAYSQRHYCVDEIHFLMDAWNKLNEKYKIERNTARKAISGGDSKYAKELTEEIDAKVAPIKKQLDVINTQIDFFKETIKTIDQILYGIKYRLDYESNFNRMS